MDSDEWSGSDSNSICSQISDTEIDDFILPDLEEPEIAGEVTLQSIAHEGHSSSQEILDDASQVIEGKISVTQYENAIKEKGFTSSRTTIPAVAALIGQANMSFVRGDYEESLRLCKEAIRIDPTAAEPYRTMSEMYDDVGEHEKGLQLGIIAAAMAAGDAENWASLGDKAVDLEKPREALYCYSKAIKVNPALVYVYLTMMKLYDPEKEKKLIILTYQKLVQRAPVELGASLLEYAQTGAQLLHEENDLEGALAIMEMAFKRVPDAVKFDDVNLIIELYITLRKYEETLQIISRYCDVNIEAEDDLVADTSTSEVTTSSFRVINCTINGEIPLQIRSKLIIALINLQAFHLVEPIIAPVLSVAEEYGDLLIDIIEVFMAENRPGDALPLLKVLVNSKNFNLPQVWLHYADCLKKLDRREEAVSAYLMVMDKAPQLADARLVVSELLNELGRGDEAITALTQDPNSGYLDVGMLYERCLLLKGNPARALEFLAVGRLLLSRHCARFRNRKEFCTFIRYSRCHNKQEALKKFHETDVEEPMYVEGKRMPTAEEEFDLFKCLCKISFDTKQYALLQRIACSGLGSKIICRNSEREVEVYALAALSSFFNRDFYAGHTFFKFLVSNGFDNNRIWNVFNIVISESDDLRHQKYVMRQLNRKPLHTALPLIFANNCFISGTYKQALSEYLLQFKNEPTPLLALLVSITCLQISLQKNAKSVNALIAQSMGFLAQYKELRGAECLQETHYNFGRLNHQLGILPAALHHYKQVLVTPAPCEMFDLKKEAAYNISRIYQASKSYDLARYYVQKYITI